MTKSRATGWLPALDGTRGIAILLVLLVHTDETGFFGGGAIGVDLFFVLSGFLITTQLLRPRVEVGRFLLRRLARLWPALLALNAFALISNVAFGNPVAALPASALYVYNQMVARHFPFGDDSLVSHTWSLSIEMQFYVGWALLGTFLARRASRSVMVAATVALAMTSYIIRAGYVVAGDEWAGYFSTEARLDAILAGAVAAVVLSEDRWSGAVAPFGRPLIPVLATVAAAIAFKHLSAGSLLIGIPIAISAGLAVTVAAVTTRGGGTMRVLASPVLTWLGTRSYSLYLWHQPLFVVLRYHSGLSDWPLYIGQWGLSLAAADLSYRLIETPARRWLYSRIGSSSAREAASAA